MDQKTGMTKNQNKYRCYHKMGAGVNKEDLARISLSRAWFLGGIKED